MDLLTACSCVHTSHLGSGRARVHVSLQLPPGSSTAWGNSHHPAPPRVSSPAAVTPGPLPLPAPLLTAPLLCGVRHPAGVTLPLSAGTSVLHLERQTPPRGAVVSSRGQRARCRAWQTVALTPRKTMLTATCLSPESNSGSCNRNGRGEGYGMQEGRVCARAPAAMAGHSDTCLRAETCEEALSSPQ